MLYSFDSGPVTLISFLVVSVLVTYYVATSIKSYRKLQHFSGPWLASFSQLWLFSVTARGDLYLEAERVLRKYGMQTPLSGFDKHEQD